MPGDDAFPPGSRPRVGPAAAIRPLGKAASRLETGPSMATCRGCWFGSGSFPARWT